MSRAGTTGRRPAPARRPPPTATLALVTTAVTFLAVTAGGLVRATDSGLGCPGWPKCFGKWVPPADHHAIIEMTHRYFVSISIVLALIVLVLVLVRHRRDRPAVALAASILPLFFGQALVGAYVVEKGVEANRTIAWTVVAHLALAMIVVATLILLTLRLRSGVRSGEPKLVRPAVAAAIAVYGLLLLGSYVTGRDAGLAFGDWPLMDGRAVPPGLDRLAPFLHFAHRLAALVAGVLVAVVAIRARGRSGPAARLARAAGWLFAAQVLIGGLNVFTRLHSAVVTTHLALSAVIWGTLVAVVALARARPAGAEAGTGAVTGAGSLGRAGAGGGVTDAPPAAGPADGGRRGRHRTKRDKVSAYVALTKPRIIELLLVTTVPTMIVAARGLPSLWLIAATVAGGTLAAGGANAINMFIDRDIDRLMNRTKRRPLVTGALTPRSALTFAIALETFAFLELWLLVNLLSALLAVGATLFYVFVYTIWLKRTSAHNIVIGGAAGAVPVLVGWSAVTGSLGAAPLVLFALIFWWTPPHFWALAIKYRDDYAAADVPMLPVVASLAATARRILFYTVLLWAVSLLFYRVAGMGDVYLAAALFLGAVFTWHAVQLLRHASPERAIRLFGYSISYISLLFGAMAADSLLFH